MEEILVPHHLIFVLPDAADTAGHRAKQWRRLN
jgi:hypothetical protein